MEENDIIKKAFSKAVEELKLPPSLDRKVLGPRNRFPIWTIPIGTAAGLFLGALLTHLWHTKEEYILMSEGKPQGVHVVFEKDAKIGQLEEFLRERGLSMSGPTQAGTFFIRDAKEEHVKELKRLNLVKEVFE